MTLKEKADRVFSQYMRSRDCPNGRGRCISCSRSITPKTCDAGHYIPRGHMATRFDDRNVNAQCIDCNRNLNGNLLKYAKALRLKYDHGIVEELMGKSRQITKMSHSDYQRIIRKYTTKQ